MIKKEKNLYFLYLKDGSKVLGRFKTLKAAKERENVIKFFKHRGKKGK